MADADRLVAALRYQQEMEEANRAAYGNPSIMRQGSRSMRSPEQKAKVRENVMDVAKFVTGETPGEMMFNVATLPLGVPARLAAGGMSLLTASDEAEAGKGAIAKTARDKLVAAFQAKRNRETAESLRKVALQDEALRLAQQRAALPVEQHGLGLPAGNTPQQRADAMGFEMGWAHGSPNPNITQMRGSTIGAEGPGAYATNYLPEANTYAKAESGATNYPLAVRKTDTFQAGGANPYDLLGAADDAQLAAKLSAASRDSIQATQQQTPQWLLDAGVPMLPVRSHYVSQNPDNFRSRFAAFDPFRRNAALAAALGVAAPDLLAEEK